MLYVFIPCFKRWAFIDPRNICQPDKTLCVRQQGRPSSTLGISVSQTKPSVLYKVGLHPLSEYLSARQNPSSTLGISVNQTKPCVLYNKVGLHPPSEYLQAFCIEYYSWTKAAKPTGTLELSQIVHATNHPVLPARHPILPARHPVLPAEQNPTQTCLATDVTLLTVVLRWLEHMHTQVLHKVVA